LLKDLLKDFIMEVIPTPSSVRVTELKILNMLEDQEILKIVEARLADGQKPVKMSLDDL
jgi:hypothetical protein